jgi:hypothetical protein
MHAFCSRYGLMAVVLLGGVLSADTQDSRPSQNEFDKWRYEAFTDEITGKQVFKARLLTDAAPRGWFEVEATCGSVGVFLQTTYLTGIDNEKDNPGTIDHRVNQILVVRLNIDGEARTGRSMPEKFGNAATFQFPAPDAMAQVGGLGIIAALADGLAKAGGAPNPGTAPELFKAHSIKMEIPLGDGSNPVLRMQPQDPEFQKFASQCVKQYPDLTMSVSAPDANQSPVQPFLDALKSGKDPVQLPKTMPGPTGAGLTTPPQPKPDAPSPINPVPATAQKQDNPLIAEMNKLPPNLAALMISNSMPGPPSISKRIGANLMRNDLSATLASSGIHVPQGAEPPEAFRRVCKTNAPDCNRNLLRASTAGAVASRISDMTGSVVLSPVAPGDYYLLIYGSDERGRNVYWYERLTLKAGANSFTASAENAKPLR